MGLISRVSSRTYRQSKHTKTMLRLGDEAPNFTAETTLGPINFHDFLEKSWGVLFSHPADFTPVCTTELAKVATMKNDFDSRNVKVAAYSCDSVESHRKWTEDIEKYAIENISNPENPKVWYPIIDGCDRKVAELYGMIDKLDNLQDAQGLPLTVRSVFVISPDKKIRCIITYPASTGRNFDEVIRVIDSLQLAPKHGLATPQNWKPGQQCVVLPSVSDEAAIEKFGKFDAKFKYLRLVDAPDSSAKL